VEDVGTAIVWLKANGADLVHQMFWWLVLLAVLGVLKNLGAIHKIVNGIRHARSPIWDLRDTVDQLTKLEPAIKELKSLEPLIRKLGQDVPLLFEKVDASNKKLTELQLDSVASRTDDEVDRDAARINGFSNSDDDRWADLQEYWRRNTRRLEYIIDKIPDGRTRLAFDRMSRTNYRAIITRLEEGGFLTKASANASRDLIDLFNKYRPRNRKVTAAVVDPLTLVDRQLDSGIVPHDKIVEVDISTESITPSGGFYRTSASDKAGMPTDKLTPQQRR
jgi:hypothetical protein